MSHKSIVSVLAGLFCLGVATSILFLSNVIFYPEFFYALFFAILVLVCIVFFRWADKGPRKNKKQDLVKVVDSDVFIFRSEDAKCAG